MQNFTVVYCGDFDDEPGYEKLFHCQAVDKEEAGRIFHDEHPFNSVRFIETAEGFASRYHQPTGVNDEDANLYSPNFEYQTR